jgi:glycosyltransferase involved in cell wall biosynthesis
VRSALAAGAGLPVWVVDDGSDPATVERLARLAAEHESVTLLRHETNHGKGAAVLTGVRAARQAGFTHALTLDADGQHPAACIGAFVEAARDHPEALVLGRPVFSADAPALRVQGRKISNFWANLETLWAGIGDSLFGMRIYLIDDLVAVMEESRWMRRLYFDTEEDGVSHFRYGRDNRLLIWMHLRLFAGFLRRLPRLLMRRRHNGQAGR